MKTENLVIGGILVTAAAIRIITDLIVPFAALLLTLAGWRPTPSAAVAPAPMEQPRRPLALASEPTPAPVAFITPRGMLEATTVPVLRIMARERGIGRDVYNYARKDELIRAILAASADRGGAGRASG